MSNREAFRPREVLLTGATLLIAVLVACCGCGSGSTKATKPGSDSSGLKVREMTPQLEAFLDDLGTAIVNKDFATADRIRDVLQSAGIVLEDRKGGTSWRKE